MGLCAKQTVTCTLVTPDGLEFSATNACLNPQKVCPREPGEGYEKCKTICNQQGHAEEQALKLLGERARGTRAYIEGHTWCCKNCQELLFKTGVLSVTIGKPPNG